MPRVGPMELVIVLLIVTMLFGVGKLPQVGGSIGKALREFRRAQEGSLDEMADGPPGQIPAPPAEESAGSK